MQKTSVYLSPRLKEALAARAAATGRSEAEVIRAALEAEVWSAAGGPSGSAASASTTRSAPVAPGSSRDLQRNRLRWGVAACRQACTKLAIADGSPPGWWWR